MASRPLNCISIGGKKYLDLDMSIQCFDKSMHKPYILYFSIPLIIFWGLAIAIILFYKIYITKQKYNQIFEQMQYSIFIAGKYLKTKDNLSLEQIASQKEKSYFRKLKANYQFPKDKRASFQYSEQQDKSQGNSQPQKRQSNFQKLQASQQRKINNRNFVKSDKQFKQNIQINESRLNKIKNTQKSQQMKNTTNNISFESSNNYFKDLLYLNRPYQNTNLSHQTSQQGRISPNLSIFANNYFKDDFFLNSEINALNKNQNQLQSDKY
ncbi:hypothetical protein ABPG72_006559 [Tetrahymena utriculariae]